MAGDWIKLEHTLPEKPEIDILAESLAIDPDEVVGKLARVWIWADQHSLDGHAVIVTAAGLDRRARCPGFAEALRKVGWLEGRDGALTFPRFDRHNGQTAKARVLARERKVRERSRDGHAENVTPTGERREEKSINTGSLSMEAGEIELCASKAAAPARPGSTPRSVTEVIAYAGAMPVTSDMRSRPDEGFCGWYFDSNESAGWVDDRGHPIRDWKAGLRSSWRGRMHRDAEHLARANNRSRQPQRVMPAPGEAF